MDQVVVSTTPDKVSLFVFLFFLPKSKDFFFLFLHKNIGCGYSLEVPRRGTSNEYPQPMFSRRNKKNIYLNIPLICCHVSSYSENMIDISTNHAMGKFCR